MSIRDYWREIEAALGHHCEVILNPAGQGWHVQIKTHSGDSLAVAQAPMLPAAVLKALEAAHKRVVG